MHTSAVNMYIWVQANRKEISQEEFLRQTGMDFSIFSSTYKKECREAWSYYQDVNEIKKEKPTIATAREKYLLNVISVWKKRYLRLKNQPTNITSE